MDLAEIEEAREKCTPLPDPGVFGGYLLDPTGRPLWVDSEATPIRLGDDTGWAITDGTRVLRRGSRSRVRGGLIVTSAHGGDRASADPHPAIAVTGDVILGAAEGPGTRFVLVRDGGCAEDLPVRCDSWCSAP